MPQTFSLTNTRGVTRLGRKPVCREGQIRLKNAERMKLEEKRVGKIKMWVELVRLWQQFKLPCV